MTQDNWESVESSLNDIKNEIDSAKEELSSLNEIKLGRRVQDVLDTVYYALSNIEQYADSIYSTCEDDYCNTENDEDELELTDEVRAVLPKKKQHHARPEYYSRERNQAMEGEEWPRDLRLRNPRRRISSTASRLNSTTAQYRGTSRG